MMRLIINISPTIGEMVTVQEANGVRDDPAPSKAPFLGSHSRVALSKIVATSYTCCVNLSY